MRLLWIREQQIFSMKELERLFEHVEDSKRIIDKLERFEILKRTSKQGTLSPDELNTNDFQGDQDRNIVSFSLHFVGMIVIGETVLVCYPKYITNNAQPYREMWQIFKVFDKPEIKNLLLNDFDQQSGMSFSHLAIIKNLIDNYLEHGLYEVFVESYEKNGQGEIDWEKTISQMQPLLDAHYLYYLNVITRERSTKANYFTNLHACILTQASQYLHDLQIDVLFELPEISLYDGSLRDFGEQNYILMQIEKEMCTQFSSSKQYVMKLMYDYVVSFYNHEDMMIYGVVHFEMVWEVTLSAVLDNQLKQMLMNLHLGHRLSKKYNPHALLIDIIERPLWTFTNKRALDTFVPDIVTLKRWGVNDYFIICDAKYYVPKLSAQVTPTNQPGIEAVAKQFCYELVYKEFICDHDLIPINCFLLPTQGKNVLSRGSVSMDMFEATGLKPILVRFIPAVKVFEFFIENKQIDLRILNLVENK